MNADAITSAVTQITTLASDALGIITGNAALMIFFCAGLIGVGFGVIRSAKRAARS